MNICEVGAVKCAKRKWKYCILGGVRPNTITHKNRVTALSYPPINPIK